MKINGINFIILDKQCNKVLGLLLKEIEAEKFHWQSGDTDAFILPSLENTFVKGSYSGKDLLRMSEQEVFYVFAELMAFNETDSLMPMNYDEYINGDCEIAIFIVDTYCYSVYAKDNGTFERIKNFVSKTKCKKVEILTEEKANFHFGV